MICDSNFILDPADRACPKLEELARILAECMGNPEVKVLIFSEWERMLELVGGLCRRLRFGFATPHGRHLRRGSGGRKSSVSARTRLAACCSARTPAAWA